MKANKKTIATYQSNALGERVMAKYSSNDGKQIRYYLYDKQKRIAELDENGHVIQQFLYLNESPVAVINSPTVSSETNQAGIVAIHTDRRHAPMMATDAQGEVIWQAEYDAWGKLIQANHQQKSDTEQSSPFNMNLRLPGQWQDQATGLYYNYQRDYNPDTGRYLTPDPLGFPDGPDAYAYVGYDPLNNVDSLGLYEIDIHYYMTFFLGVAAGIPSEDARVIALAAQYIDENPATKPVDTTSLLTTVWSTTWNQEMLIKYHFTLSGSEDGKTIDKYDNGFVNYVIDNPSSQLNLLSSASGKAPSKCAQLQLFGEYLHAFEDTFAHRDKNNIPYDAQGWFGLGTGHGAADGHEPDYTYNDNGWSVREDRTYAMELAVFNKLLLTGYGDNKKAMDINLLKATLSQFNKIQENDETGFENKLALLNQALLDFGYKNKDGSPIDLFNQNRFDNTIAAENRDKFLCDASGHRLKQEDYPGTILPVFQCGI